MTPSAAVPTLFGWPERADGQGPASSVEALGVAVDSGNGVAPGARDGPQSIRLASLTLAPPEPGGIDGGDLLPLNGEDPGTTIARAEAAVDGIISRGRLPLVLGGDHAISYAPVAQLQRRRKMCVIWFDAHTDFSPWSRRPGHNHKQVLRRIASLPSVEFILQVGYRGFTVEDERRLGEHVEVLTTAEVRCGGANALLARIPPGMGCYVSVDIDVLDPKWAPGTSTPVPGGLSPEPLMDLLAAILRNCPVIGMDLMEVNPSRDRSGRTSLVSACVLRKILQAWPNEYEITSR